MPPMRQRAPGFTLIELLVVLAIMATLMAIVAPRYFASLDRAKDAALKTNLRILRESIDKYHADTGKYPESLNQLVQARYIQAVPIDPITDSELTWKTVPPPNDAASAVYDVHSGAPGTGLNGKPYQQW
jgi:general secretion pathway protein G